MLDARRPLGRLFYLVLSVVVLLGASLGQTPTTTTISDVVYRADGTLAGGTLLISWPTFSTSAGQSVAAGKKSVTLGPGGTLSVALVPNTGANPADSGTNRFGVGKFGDASGNPAVRGFSDRRQSQRCCRRTQDRK